MSAWRNRKDGLAKTLMATASREAVLETAHIVLAATKQEVPLDEGTLSRSGIVIAAPGGAPAAAIVYGGGPGTGHPLVAYAKHWHENDANFQHGRKSQYLRDPFNRLAARVLQDKLQAAGRGAL
jgi:hypothetical protein